MLNKISKNNLKRIRDLLEKEGNIKLKGLMNVSYFESFNKEIESKNPLTHSYTYQELGDGSDVNQFMKKLVSKKLKSSRLFTLKHKDYKILNDDVKEINGYKVIIELTEKWDHKWGGYTTFVKDNKEVLRIYPERHTIIIIKMNNLREYIKYINHKAKNHERRFIELIYA